MSLWKIENGKLSLPFHYGQTKAWESDRRFIFVLAGTQSGKTSWLPWWLVREVKQTADPAGDNDYIATTANYDLFKLKFLPEMRQVFEYLLGIGRYWSGERIIELKDPQRGFWASRVDDPMWGRIILRSAASPAGLESATARAAILDEAGQDEYTLEIWEAILRRLSLNQGRICAATTLYNLGWIKSEIYDVWQNGAKDIDIIQFASIANPTFPRAEFERAKRTMQDWRFSMFYLGKFSRPAGLIYADFTPAMVVDPFTIPDDWPVVVGVDFGGANTATIWLAEEPGTERWYIFRESLEGGKSAREHVETAQAVMRAGVEYDVVGGAGSEGQQRMDWTDAGLFVAEPPVSGVEAGIDRVTELIKTDRLRVFRNCKGLRDELGGYQRKLDEFGNPTDEIIDKRKFHRLDALRYAASLINEPIQDLDIITISI